MTLEPYTFSAPPQDYERDDTVHFSPNSSNLSWAGQVSEEEDMPKDDVREYISGNNPRLFQKLCGLLLSSSAIPLSFHGQRTLHRLVRNRAEPSLQFTYYAPLSRLPVQPARAHMQNAPTTGQSKRSHAEILTVKAKERIEYKLSNGYVLYQRELSPGEAPLPCDFALCIGKLQNSIALQYYVVEYNHASSTLCKALMSTAIDYYCHGCFDTIFTISEQEKIPPTVSNIPDRLLLDGIDHEDVMHAVIRLYPDIQLEDCSSTSFLDKHGRPDQAFNWPSNSLENHARRVHKQYEIANSLTEVGKYDKAILDEQSQPHNSLIREPSPDACVLITRPTYIEPSKDRYKKQGLTQHDRHKHNNEKRQSELLNDMQSNTPLASPVKLLDQLQERFCYCREVDDGNEMLKCSSELCSVGWFHLRCTDLQCLPTDHEQFLCCYCSGGGGWLVMRNLSDEDTNSLTKPCTPLTGENGMNVEKEEQGTNNTDYDPYSSLENCRPNEEGVKWSAVNEPDAAQAVACLIHISDNDTDSSCSDSSEVELDDANNPRAPQALKEQDDATTTSSCLHGLGASIPFSATIPDHTTAIDQASQPTTTTPATPPLQPVRPAAKPWGTPINLNKLDIFDPSSPSPTRKRKRESIEEHNEAGIRVDS